MNRKEQRIYRRLGVIVFFSLGIVLLTYLYLLFKSETYPDRCQEYTARGIDVKENNNSFKTFLYNIKRNNGVLVLGSSETGAFGRGNYHGLLNEYFDCGHDFSVLGGAGRTSHIYFPTFLNNPGLFDGLNVIYFVNPTYWRESLNYFQIEYYERYVSAKNLLNVEADMKSYGLYEKYGSQIIDANSLGSNFLDDLKDKMYILKNSFSDEKETTKADCARNKESAEIDSLKIKESLNELNLSKNISNDYDSKDHERFVKIKNSDFQLNALKGFNQICTDLNINIVYILGPFNGIYCEKYSPELCDEHKKVINQIKGFFEKEKAAYIDCSDLSYVSGSFIDVQHHSKYAAWLIADRINSFYEKNN